MSDIQIRYFSDVTETEIEWLWYPYIPYGKLTLLQGDPGEGKSTFILNVAAMVTVGGKMPDGYEITNPGIVIYQCVEDNAADTVKPRLKAAGADCSKVAYIVNDGTALTLEDIRIEEILKTTGARMLILDPIQSFFAQEGDMYSAVRMRSILGKLSVIASRYRCAVILVGHMNKMQSGKSLYRGLGSIDIAAIARSVLMVERDSSEPSIRYMYPIKASLAREGGRIGFRIGENGFSWIGPMEYSKPCAFQDSGISKHDRCVIALEEMLHKKDCSSRDIFSEMEKKGISKRTVKTVKQEIGIKSYRKQSVWYWTLSDSHTEDS